MTGPSGGEGKSLVTPPASRPMRFALALHHASWAKERGSGDSDPVTRTVESARVAGEAGIDAIWASEDPEGWDSFAILSAVAAVTDRAALGPGVVNPWHRHPNQIASSVATLDRLSGGRAFLGLGRGQVEWYRRALGIPARRPLAALEETIGLLRQWWAPPHVAGRRDPIAGGNEVFPVRGWERSVSPAQSPPGPPIYLSAVGPRALALAGRLADGILINDFASETFIREAIATVWAAARDAGRDPDRLAVIVRANVRVTNDPEPVLERRKAGLAQIATLPGMDALVRTPGFDTDEIVGRVRQAMRTDETLATGGGFPAMRRAGDLAAARAAIPTALMAELCPVGPLPLVRDRLARLAAMGVTEVTVAPPRPGESAEDYAARLAALR